MITSARFIWALASPVERFLLAIIPFTTIWDVLNSNFLDLAVGGVVFVWIVWDVIKDIQASDREEEHG